MRWNKKKRSQSTEKGTNSSTASPQLPSKGGTIESKWYHSIYELPLTRFITAHIDKNIYALVIFGHPSLEELQATWRAINIEYADVMKDRQYVAVARMDADLAQKEIKYNQIVMLIRTLEKYYTDQFKNSLNKILWTKYELNPDDPEAYEAELKNAYNRSKQLMLEIKLINLEKEEIKKRLDVNNVEPDKEYFYSTLITLQNHFKRTMEMDRLTVYEFCEQVRRMNAEHESTNNG